MAMGVASLDKRHLKLKAQIVMAVKSSADICSTIPT